MSAIVHKTSDSPAWQTDPFACGATTGLYAVYDRDVTCPECKVVRDVV